MEKEICLKKINLTPTMKCNLKCKLCGVRVPHYEYCPQMSMEEFEKNLSAVFQIVDHTEKLQITGGEPFVHPQLSECVLHCFKYESQFDKLWILTNGTIPIRPELYSVLKQYSDRIVFHISDYGVRREVTDELVETVKEIGCEYKYLKYFGEDQYFDGWVDQGDFVCHDRSRQELETVFKTCPQVKSGGFWYVRHGQMHWCGRSARGTELNKIPLDGADYVDIFAGTIEDRKDKLRKVMERTYITACDYCNGYYGTEDAGKRCPAGEQV